MRRNGAQVRDGDTEVSPESGRLFDPLPPILVGWTLIGVFFGGFGAWASTTELATTIIASGKFVVESARKSVQHLEGGIVSTIYVRDGDHVRQGDLLVQMDATSVRARYRTVRDQLDAALAERARLEALRAGANRLAFPDTLLERMVEPRVAAIINAQQKLFVAEQNTRIGQISLLKQRIEIVREQIVGLRAQKAAKEEQREIILSEYAVLKALFEKGHVSQTRVLALQRTAVQLKGEIGSLVAQLAGAEKEIGETELEIVQLENGYFFQLNDALKTLDETIAAQQERIGEFADVLTRSTVIAPADGRVLNMTVQTAGEVIRPGEQIMEIVPVDEPLVVTARVRPRDIEQVAPGQPARLRLSALDQKYTPEIAGTVSYVSADDLEDSKTGDAYYEIRIVVADDTELDPLGNLVTAGMPVEVFVYSGDRTVLSYITEPLVGAMKHSMVEK